MQAMGLDISDRSVRYVQLVRSRRGLKIGDFGARRVPDDVIKEGEIKDIDGLAKAFKGLRSDLGTELVNVSLPEERAYVVKFRTPALKMSDVRTSLELQLSDHVPLSPDEAVFDYDIIGSRKKARRKELDVALSAMPRSSVEQYLAFLSRVHLSPIALEIEAQASARAVVPRGDHGTFMVIDLGEMRTGISVVEAGTVVQSSSVGIGGRSVTEAIQKTLGIGFDEAEQIKIEKGITGSKHDEKLFPAILSVVAAIRDEVSKHFLYWHTHTGHAEEKHQPVERVILCGGNAPMLGLSDYVSSGLSVEAELADVMVNIQSLDEYIPEMTFHESLQYATAIGLALRSVQ